MDVEGSLAHAYLSPYYDPADEPLAEKPFTYDMEFDELPTKELREMVYKEAVDFKMAKLTETPLWSSSYIYFVFIPNSTQFIQTAYITTHVD